MFFFLATRKAVVRICKLAKPANKKQRNVQVKNIYTTLALLFFSPLSSSAMDMSPHKALDWDFIAPSIYDTANLPGASSGLIVYDSKTDSFYAKGPTGSSDWRSFSQGAAYSGNYDLGVCTTSKEVDWSKGNSFTVTLTTGSDCEFTFSHKVSGQSITIWVTNGSTPGEGLTTWPTSKWQGGNVPVMTEGVGALDVCTFTYNGTAVAGSCIQDMQ